ncbi:MAG TPA: peptidoglycan-binding protein [Candidatus Saccharimonadales bacterium]|nr:peptidoglycan-binding protein [Candidatus Saccharimonadales bacterium]
MSQRPSVSYPDSGSCVRVIQQDLLNHHISVGTAGVDGVFGANTRAGVIKLQGLNHLVRDGIVGPKTWTVLAANDSSRPSPPPPKSSLCQPRQTVQAGSRGDCVRVAQTLLNRHGSDLVVDGIFGNFTRAATIRYQKSVNLYPDGIIGRFTWAALDSGKGSTNPPPPPSAYNRQRGPNYTQRVMLTFDDCPYYGGLAQMQTVIRWAKAHNIGLGLFPTGQCIQAGKFSPSYARAYGQYVANHSVSHANLTQLSYSGVLRELSAPGVVTNYGRPPGGAVNATVEAAYHAKDMNIWTWNVDTQDWTGLSMATVVYRASHWAKPGDTVLMHMHWAAFNPSAINQIVQGLASRGIGVCRAYPGTTPVFLPNHLPC